MVLWVKPVHLLILVLAVLRLTRADYEEYDDANTTQPIEPEDENKIVGGQNTDVRYIPYQISLVSPGPFITCGGSIINEYTVLTAGHCIKEGQYQVRTGATYYRDPGFLYNVAAFYTHPQFNFPQNDVGIVKTTSPIQFNEYAQPIPLTTTAPGLGGEGLASGWGQISDPGGPPNILQSIWLPINDEQTCNNMYGMGSQLVCAGPVGESGRGTCYGDSGGPLAVNNQLVGVVSFGHANGCAVADGTSAFASVAYFYPWIVQQM